MDNSLEALIDKAGLSQDAAVVDLSNKKGTVERLTESKIMCSSEDKVS